MLPYFQNIYIRIYSITECDLARHDDVTHRRTTPGNHNLHPAVQRALNTSVYIDDRISVPGKITTVTPNSTARFMLTPQALHSPLRHVLLSLRKHYTHIYGTFSSHFASITPTSTAHLALISQALHSHLRHI